MNTPPSLTALRSEANTVPRDRTDTNPLFNGNRLKLGVFGLNGWPPVMTTVPELTHPTWPMSLEIAKEADAAGYEAIVPYARWLAFSDTQHPSGVAFDTFTWAAGIAAQTTYSAVMATVHVPVLHPLIVAKAAATIDHISNGRAALNIVVGGYREEIELFGATFLEHDARYEHGTEWTECLKALWGSDEPVDFEGSHVRLTAGMSQPKPIQHPYPALMNAGGSPAGRRFTATHCDIAFIPAQSNDDDVIASQVDEYRSIAREHSNRELQVWATVYVVQRDSYEEATEYVNYYVDERGDLAYADGLMAQMIENTQQFPPDVYAAVRRHLMAGMSAVGLLGTAEDIAERLQRLSAAGLDGVLLVWVNYADGIRRFNREVIPLLERSGLRTPLTADVA